MVINKYLLYLVTSLLFIIVFNIGKVPLIWNGVLVQAYSDGGIESSYYTKWGQHASRVNRGFKYTYGEYTYTYYAPSFLTGHDNFLEHWNGKMLVNKDKPEQAYIDTFLGLFADDLIITISVLLIWTFCILAIGLIPMRVKLW